MNSNPPIALTGTGPFTNVGNYSESRLHRLPINIGQPQKQWAGLPQGAPAQTFVSDLYGRGSLGSASLEGRGFSRAIRAPAMKRLLPLRECFKLSSLLLPPKVVPPGVPAALQQAIGAVRSPRARKVIWKHLGIFLRPCFEDRCVERPGDFNAIAMRE